MTLIIDSGYTPLDDPDAAVYIAAVQAADEAASPGVGALEDETKAAIHAFVKGCKNDGIWPAIKACCILAGARTTNGALVPLVGAAPTPVNFDLVNNTDYNRKTGLVGDGSTKYLDTNRNAGTADSRNNHHISVWVSQLNSEGSGGLDFAPLIAARISGSAAGSLQIINQGPTNTAPNTFNFISTNTANVVSRQAPTFAGLSRSQSSDFTSRVNNTSTLNTDTSQSLANANYIVLARTIGGSGEKFSTSRLAFYSIGESLDLALLDARVTALITAFGAAIP